MSTLIKILKWTPPLAIPVLCLGGLILLGVNLDSALPWMIGGKVWRVGNVLDQLTLLAAMAEMALAVQISAMGQARAVLGMVVPRVIMAVIAWLASVWLASPYVVLLIVASLLAPGLAGLVRVSVARRDMAIGK